MESDRPIWMTNLFEGRSFMGNEGIAFVLKELSYVTIGLFTAAIALIVHFSSTIRRKEKQGTNKIIFEDL